MISKCVVAAVAKASDSAPAKERVPNPRRVEAGRRNHALRKGLTPAGRERIRQATLRFQPWRFATGPKTPEGKRRSAANGKRRQAGPWSIRELRQQVRELRTLVKEVRQTREHALS